MRVVKLVDIIVKIEVWGVKGFKDMYLEFKCLVRVKVFKDMYL